MNKFQRMLICVFVTRTLICVVIGTDNEPLPATQINVTAARPIVLAHLRHRHRHWPHCGSCVVVLVDAATVALSSLICVCSDVGVAQESSLVHSYYSSKTLPPWLLCLRWFAFARVKFGRPFLTGMWWRRLMLLVRWFAYAVGSLICVCSWFVDVCVRWKSVRWFPCAMEIMVVDGWFACAVEIMVVDRWFACGFCLTFLLPRYWKEQRQVDICGQVLSEVK